jgi:hypothetical protein
MPRLKIALHICRPTGFSQSKNCSSVINDIAVYLSLGMLLERDLINWYGMIGSTAAKGQKEETINQ